MGLDLDLCTEYDSFSFDLVQTDIHFESCKSEAVEYDNLVIANFNFEQTLTPFEIRRLVIQDPWFCLDRSFMMT